jgi:hypothetical protein
MQSDNQPVQMKAGGQGWTCEAAAQQKVTRGGGGATRCNMSTSRQRRGNWEEKWTRGGGMLQGRGGALQGRGGASREQEEVAAQQPAGKQEMNWRGGISGQEAVEH